MSKILILGDVHLGGSLNLGKQAIGTSLNSRIEDQSNLLNWVYDQGVANKIDHIILTGDVFDVIKPHYSLIVILLDWIIKCVQSGMKVHIIMGNHEMERSGETITSPLDIIGASDISNVFVYSKIENLHLEDLSITFCPFRDRRSFNTDSYADALSQIGSQLEIEASKSDRPKMLIGHLAIEGAIPVASELDELSNELICPLSFFKNYDWTWMGHVHKFQVLQKKPYVAHIGSMDISDFGETDQKKFIVIFDIKNKEFEYLELPTRNIKKIDLIIPENVNINEFVEEAVSKLTNLQNNIIKLNIILPTNSTSNLNRKNIENLFYEKGAFHITKISEEKTFSSLKKVHKETIDNSIGELMALKSYANILPKEVRSIFIQTATQIIEEHKGNI